MTSEQFSVLVVDDEESVLKFVTDALRLDGFEVTPCSGANEAVDVAASFLTVGGAAGTLVGSAGTGFKFPLYELTICFENGRLTLRGLDGDLDVLDNRTGVQETFALSRDKSRWDQYNASFGKSLAAYLESIRQESDPPVPGVAGLMELQFEAGFRRAILKGAPVDVQEAFPLEID